MLTICSTYDLEAMLVTELAAADSSYNVPSVTTGFIYMRVYVCIIYIYIYIHIYIYIYIYLSLS